MFYNLRPAYGRDYKSKKAILEDWIAGKDFMISSPERSVYINKADAEKGGIFQVNIRYKGLRSVAVIKLDYKGEWK